MSNRHWWTVSEAITLSEHLRVLRRPLKVLLSQLGLDSMGMMSVVLKTRPCVTQIMHNGDDKHHRGEHNIP